MPTGLALGVVALAITLSGCSDESSRAGTVPSRTATASPTTASPTPSTPEEQIEAAVYTYYAELTRAVQTQDTARLKHLMSPDCPCFDTIEGIEDVAKSGRSTPDAEWTVTSLEVKDLRETVATVEVTYTVSSYAVLNRDGNVVKRYPSSDRLVDVSFVKADDQWIVGNIFDLRG